MALDKLGTIWGSFIFGQKIKFFMILDGFPGSGGDRSEEPCLVINSSWPLFFRFSAPPLDIFARNHFLIMFMNYPEPQGRRGAAEERPNREWLAAFFSCQIHHFL